MSDIVDRLHQIAGELSALPQAEDIYAAISEIKAERKLTEIAEDNIESLRAQVETLKWENKGIAEWRNEWEQVSKQLADLKEQNALLTKAADSVAGQEPEVWIMVDGCKHIPKGDWLVYLEENILGSKIHAASVHPNITTIATMFEFDAPKVLAYRPIPAAPTLDKE